MKISVTLDFESHFDAAWFLKKITPDMVAAPRVSGDLILDLRDQIEAREPASDSAAPEPPASPAIEVNALRSMFTHYMNAYGKPAGFAMLESIRPGSTRVGQLAPDQREALRKLLEAAK